MNIKSTAIGGAKEPSTNKPQSISHDKFGGFAEELKSVKNDSEVKNTSESDKTSGHKNEKTADTGKEQDKLEAGKANEASETDSKSANEKKIKQASEQESEVESEQDKVSDAKDDAEIFRMQNGGNGLKNVSGENDKSVTGPGHGLNGSQDDIEKAFGGLENMVRRLSQPEEKNTLPLKKKEELSDKDREGETLINNDFNIDNKDKLPQMNLNMSFGGDGQPFSSFMKNDEQQGTGDKKLSSSAKDLAEEAAVLSTMAENVAIANMAQQQTEAPKEKVVNRNDGIKKIDTNTGIVKETIVKYDSVVMSEADVDLFVNLVENGSINTNITESQNLQRSLHVSKTLADMLAKAMEDNKPVRIDFDNNISVIIKISRDGKISADFLPSSQVAEAYLKENLPLLRQRFEEQNVKYDELNQRERRGREQDSNRKKGRENE